MRRLTALFILLLATASAHAAELTTADSAVLHYDTFGKGDPVIVLSGGPGFSGADMLPLATHIGRKHMAVLLDQRGTGRSTVPAWDMKTINVATFVADIEALRMKVGAEKITLIGHS